MASITLVTMGSWGDLFPFVGLGRALVDRGHEVRLAASPAWEEVAVGAGVPFVGVGQRFGFEELGRHPEIFRRVPLGLRHALGRFVFDQIDELTDDLRDAMADGGPRGHPSGPGRGPQRGRAAGCAPGGGDGVPGDDPQLDDGPRRHPGGSVVRPGRASREPYGLAQRPGGHRRAVRPADQHSPPPDRPPAGAGGAAGAAPAGGGHRRHGVPPT